MAGSQPHALILEIESDELPTVSAAIVCGLDDLAHTGAGESNAYKRLVALQLTVKGLSGRGSFRIALDRTDAELLRAGATMIMAMHGYVVARPAAIVTLTTVHQKLDRLLKDKHDSQSSQ